MMPNCSLFAYVLAQIIKWQGSQSVLLFLRFKMAYAFPWFCGLCTLWGCWIVGLLFKCTLKQLKKPLNQKDFQENPFWKLRALIFSNSPSGTLDQPPFLSLRLWSSSVILSWKFVGKQGKSPWAYMDHFEKQTFQPIHQLNVWSKYEQFVHVCLLMVTHHMHM